MILLLGGTRDAIEVSAELRKREINFLTTVVTEYGAALAGKHAPEVIKGSLEEQSLRELIAIKGVKSIVDMTHPYAEEISRLARRVAEDLRLEYYRYQRPETLIDSTIIGIDESYEEAAVMAVKIAKERQGSVFLTIGSKRAHLFKEEGRRQGVRVVCRVLPDPRVLTELLAAGVDQKDIVAVLGPFSQKMNTAMFVEYNAAVVVTKDAGTTGGTDTKILAAEELGIPVRLIRRPKVAAENVFCEINDLLRRVTK